MEQRSPLNLDWSASQACELHWASFSLGRHRVVSPWLFESFPKQASHPDTDRYAGAGAPPIFTPLGTGHASPWNFDLSACQACELHWASFSLGRHRVVSPWLFESFPKQASHPNTYRYAGAGAPPIFTALGTGQVSPWNFDLSACQACELHWASFSLGRHRVVSPWLFESFPKQASHPDTDRYAGAGAPPIFTPLGTGQGSPWNFDSRAVHAWELHLASFSLGMHTVVNPEIFKSCLLIII